MTHPLLVNCSPNPRPFASVHPKHWPKTVAKGDDFGRNVAGRCVCLARRGLKGAKFGRSRTTVQCRTGIFDRSSESFWSGRIHPKITLCFAPAERCQVWADGTESPETPNPRPFVLVDAGVRIAAKGANFGHRGMECSIRVSRTAVKGANFGRMGMTYLFPKSSTFRSLA